MENIIETRDITKEFAGVKALKGVNLNVRKGEIHAIVGENGAGKSTLMKILSGVYTPTTGSMSIDGQQVAFHVPHDAKNHGIGIIHQEFSLVPDMSAIDNIFLGEELTTGGIFVKRKEMRELSRKMIDELEGDFDIRLPVRKLSVANQQFIEIAKATAEDPKILIFDEPTASLTGNEVQILFRLINRLKEKGVTILYISHHLDEIYTLSDRFSVLRDGEYIGTCETASTPQHEMVKMMVGREVEQQFPPRVSSISDEVVLKVNNLQNDRIKDIQFQLHKGEIIGFAGLVGAGRTEIVRAIIGADKTEAYDVEVNGASVHLKSPSEALKYGIGLIPEDRKGQGLLLGMSVKENSTIASLNKILSKIGLINKAKENQVVEKSIQDLYVKTPSMNQAVKNLSGGNQQKVVLAKWINTDVNILVFDEPTRGIDIGAKDEIYKLIRQLSEDGMSIIIISSELPEVLGLSDRVLPIYNGRIATEIEAKDVTQENVMYYCTGGK